MPCDSDLPASEKRWSFEIGVIGLRMRDDSGAGFIAVFSYPPGRQFTVEQDIGRFFWPDDSFGAEYGSGDFAGEVRFRNPTGDVCIQVTLPFEDEYGHAEPLVAAFCDDTEPLQASDRWNRPNRVILNLMPLF